VEDAADDSDEETPDDSAKAQVQPRPSLMPRGTVQPDVPIFYDHSAMIMHAQRIVPTLGLKPKKDNSEEARRQEFAARLARPSFGGQLPNGASNSPGLQNLDELAGAFHGVGDDDDGRNQQEPLFSRSNAVDCQLHEAIDEVKRLYCCLRWLLQDRNFEDGLEEEDGEDKKDDANELDTGNTFLSSARDNKRWRDFAERDAGVNAREADDVPDKPEEKEQPQSHSRYRLFDPSTGATGSAALARTESKSSLGQVESPTKNNARSSLSVPKPRRSRMGTLKGPPTFIDYL